MKNLILILVVAGIGVAVWFLATNNSGSELSQSVSTVQQGGNQTRYTYEGEEGVSALELLKKRYNVSIKDVFGILQVESIEGQTGDGKGAWRMYVNGERVTTAADQYLTKDGDKIEWRYEKN